MILICKYKNITKTYYNLLVYLYTQKNRLSAVKGSVHSYNSVVTGEVLDDLTKVIDDTERRAIVATSASAGNLLCNVLTLILAKKTVIGVFTQLSNHVDLEHNKYLLKAMYLFLFLRLAQDRYASIFWEHLYYTTSSKQSQYLFCKKQKKYFWQNT